LNESLPGRIFICYRRQETAWPAMRLYDALVENFSAEQVFKDVQDIEPGEDFVERLTAEVASSDVLLALIGPQWLTITDSKGQRRLDDPDDYVRREIETALTRKVRVIPVLVDEMRMPRANELPPTLAPLARLNAVQISPITFETEWLIAMVGKTLAELKAADTTIGSASSTATPRVDRLKWRADDPEVEQLYNQALVGFLTEQWDKAVDSLSQVVTRQPDYADAARKLTVARRQQVLAMRYAQASTAADGGDWEQAIAGYSWIVNADPSYRDTRARLAVARHQQRLVILQDEARRLHRAGQWAAVIMVGEHLHALDPTAADPDGVVTSAVAELAELAAAQQAAKLVFLCHASRDNERVRQLAHQLMADGIDCWLDEERLLPGQDWEYEINRAISKSKFVLACLSRNSVTKAGYVQKELKTVLDAADRQPEGVAFLIPVRLEECDVPQRLSRWQWVDLFKEGGYERLIRGLKA
jgi:tetratricopeptide (TPR) repeat protein